MPPATPDRYDGIQRMFHWTVASLILAQAVIALVLPAVVPKSGEDTVAYVHTSVGSTILLLMLLRLGWRLSHRVPPPPADLAPGLRVLSRATHWAFYGVLVVLPVLGWVTANAYGGPVRLLGFIPLPRLVGPDHALAERTGQVHATLAWGLFALVALHVAGAAFHAFVKRDGVVGRMRGPGYAR